VKNYIKAALILALLLISAPTLAQEKATAEPFEGFDDFVADLMAEWQVPGLALAVVKDGEVLYAKGYGKRDVEGDLPVTTGTLFAIGSTTKAFTALALGMLVEDGLLDWDKPVRDYLPGFTLHDEYATMHMTPLDLVNHRSGLPRHDGVWYNSGLTREETFNRLRYLEFSAELRETFQYNNLMFMTAGYLVGRVTKSTWEDFVKSRILKPLGMEATVFGPPKAEGIDVASPYELKEGKPVKVPPYDDWAIGPAGSINSSVDDMSRWLIFHMGEGKVGDTEIVSKSTLRSMHTPRMILSSPGSKEFPMTAYGMGWVIESYRGHKYVWHNGGIDGFYAYIGFLEFEKLGIVILTNLSDHPVTEVVSRTLFDRMTGLEEIDWNARLRERREQRRKAEEQEKEEIAKARKHGTTPSHPLEDYVGRYTHPAYGDIEVLLDEGKLRGKFHGFTEDLEHYHYDEFVLTGEGEQVRVTFGLNEQGDVAELRAVLEPAVDPIVFRRATEANRQPDGSFAANRK
jgi:CubicO group peptidase (beta-lactamase class C family)